MTLLDFKNTELPDAPGVYRFVDTAGVILYVGRATSLRDRVRSYFGRELIHERGPALVDMVVRAHHIEWTETSSVLEAVIVEANLIKKLQPYYNTKEKDNKSYYYVVVTDEEYPRVFLERGRSLQYDNESGYAVRASFGPYPNGPIIREGLRLLRRIFPFRSGKTKNPQRDRFYEMLGLQQSTSVDARSSYHIMIDDFCRVMEGQWGALIDDLTLRMTAASQHEHFEDALRLRNMIWSLQHIRDVSLIKSEDKENRVRSIRIEAYDVAHMSGKSMVGVMVVLENGEPQKSEYRKFHIRGIESSNDPAALSQILARRFRHREWRMPNIMVCDGNQVQLNIGEEAKNAFRIDAAVVSVVKDERHQPRDILGDRHVIDSWRDAILLANAEAHRYALGFHKKTRDKNFIPDKKSPE
jgi:excinuclease UvrABC nuclease subunit